MGKATKTHFGVRIFWAKASLLALAMCILFWPGCREQRNQDKPDNRPQTSKPVCPDTATQDAARIKQLRNIVANRGIRAIPGPVHQLAESRAEGAFEAIASGLTDENLMVRMYSATALGTLGDERAVPLLRKAMKSKYTGLRLAAVVGLGKLGPKARPAVPELGAMLTQQFAPMHPSVQHTHPDDDVQGTRTITMRFHLAVLKSLGGIGGPEAESIAAGVLETSANTEMGWAAARALRAMAARDALVAAGTNGITSAWRMLAEMKHTEALPAMLAQATDKAIPESRRRQIVYALGVLQDRRATPVLLDMLQSKSESLCEAAAWALNMVADPQSLQGLLDYVQTAPDKGSGLYSAACAIGAIEGPDALTALSWLANHPSSMVREAVAYRLDERATADDLPLLIALISNPKPGNHFPTRAMARLLPASVEPLIKLLPDAKPEMQARIAAVLVQHESGRPAVREMLNSSNEMVRNSARQLLWEQRDPTVPISWFFDRNEYPPTSVDQRDVPALKRLTPRSGDAQACLILASLFHFAPEDAWPVIRPLFYEQDIAPVMRAYNSIGEGCPQWVATEMLNMLEDAQLPEQGKIKLLALLRKQNNISNEAVRIYRRMTDDASYSVRHRAYECLWHEASDESMLLLAQKALAGDHPARWVIGGNPDKRLAETFVKLVAEAIEKKETWVGGYVHCWATAPGVAEYVSAIGSHYSEAMESARRVAAETVPD